MLDPMTMQAMAVQLQDGDVVVFRCDDYLDEASFSRIAEAVQCEIQKWPMKVYPLILDKGMTVDTLPSGRMRDLGWVRIEEPRAS